MHEKLSVETFDRIRSILHSISGISLDDSKRALVSTRLSRRIKDLGVSSIEEYARGVENGKLRGEMHEMVDVLTTNVTSFFREFAHFDCLREKFERWRQAKKSRIRIWCAGCSSGEEPYSIAIMLHERFGDIIDLMDVKLLATDLSKRMIEKAREALYPQTSLKTVPYDLVLKYFQLKSHQKSNYYKVEPRVRGLVRFAAHNLMGEWPMSGPFDAVFCRNVMIYFDRPTQIRLISRFHDILEDGGCLFVGHSESLIGFTHGFEYVKPGVYVKRRDR